MHLAVKLLGAGLVVGLSVGLGCSSSGGGTQTAVGGVPGGGGFANTGGILSGAGGGFSGTGNVGVSGTGAAPNVGGAGGGLAGTGGLGTGATAGTSTGGSAGSSLCKGSGTTCTTGIECCTSRCDAGKCSGTQCTGDGLACMADGECCGGVCTSGMCAAAALCKVTGNACMAHTECCSQYCKDGLCARPSFCGQTGDLCANDSDCCGGLCTKGTGTLGLCAVAQASGASGCFTEGAVCGSGASYMGGTLPTCGGECCSRACFPDAVTGVLICQPPSGCRPTGELCKEDVDCCGSATLPDGMDSGTTCEKAAGAAFGRCDQGHKCSPAGSMCRLQTITCNATDTCCAGNVQQTGVCKQDALGIPRCLIAAVDCTDPTSYAGKACASSADCCGLPCTKNPLGTPPYVCGMVCVAEGGDCTTDTDCCAGLLCINGKCGKVVTCAAYGQSCTTNSDCCNMVPCTRAMPSDPTGFCRVPTG